MTIRARTCVARCQAKEDIIRWLAVVGVIPYRVSSQGLSQSLGRIKMYRDSAWDLHMHIHLLRRLMIIHFIDQVTRQASYLTCPFLTAFPFEHLRLSRSGSTTTVAAASAEWQIIIEAIEFSRLFKMCYRMSEDTDQTFKTEEFSQFLFSQGHCCAICVFKDLFHL